MKKPKATPEDIQRLIQEAGTMFGDPDLITDLLKAKTFTPTVIARAIAATDRSHSCRVTYMDAMERKKLIEQLSAQN